MSKTPDDEPIPDLGKLMAQALLLDPRQYDIDRAKVQELIHRHHPDGVFKAIEEMDISKVVPHDCDSRIGVRFPAWLGEWRAYLQTKYRHDPDRALATIGRFLLEFTNPSLGAATAAPHAGRPDPLEPPPGTPAGAGPDGSVDQPAYAARLDRALPEPGSFFNPSLGAEHVSLFRVLAADGQPGTWVATTFLAIWQKYHPHWRGAPTKAKAKRLIANFDVLHRALFSVHRPHGVVEIHAEHMMEAEVDYDASDPVRSAVRYRIHPFLSEMLRENRDAAN
jgi:hypothetical protein